MVAPVRQNLGPSVAFRAPGVMEGTFGFEQALDELAEKLGIDPLELRRLNHSEDDPESGKPYTSKRLLECYDRAAELAGWDGRDALRGDGRDPARDGRLEPVLVGRRRAARVRRGAGRQGRPAGGHRRAPGPRHRHDDRVRRDRRRAPRSPRRHDHRVRRRHVADRARALLGRLDDARLDRAGGALGRPPRAHRDPRPGRRHVRDLGLRPDARGRRDPLGRRHAARADHRGDGQARKRLDLGLGLSRAEPRGHEREHVRLPDRPGRRRHRHGRGDRRAGRRRARHRPRREPDGRAQPGDGRDPPGHRLRADGGAGRRSHDRHGRERRPRGLQGADDRRPARGRLRVRRTSPTRTSRWA